MQTLAVICEPHLGFQFGQVCPFPVTYSDAADKIKPGMTERAGEPLMVVFVQSCFGSSSSFTNIAMCSNCVFGRGIWVAMGIPRAPAVILAIIIPWGAFSGFLPVHLM